MKWIRKKINFIKCWWQWIRLSREERQQAKKRAQAMQQLLGNVLANAPINKIIAGETCSWNMTPEQKQGAMEGIQEYVNIAKSKEVNN